MSKGGLFLLVFSLSAGFSATAALVQTNLLVVPVWDGETVDCRGQENNHLINRFGGNPLTNVGVTVEHTTNILHSGTGAYEIKIATPIPIGASTFFGTALTGFGTNATYIDTRDITPFEQIRFWLRNDTGARFTLVLEIKDFQDSNNHRAQTNFVIEADASWMEFRVPLPHVATNSWIVQGDPDFSRTKQFVLVIEANQGDAVGGPIYLDDLALVESGAALDPQSGPIQDILERLARRNFLALWGARDRETGLLPNLSQFADVTALNATAALVKLLPTAVVRGWITQADSDDYVSKVVVSLHRALDNANPGYVPTRYLDRVNLTPNFVLEESSVDAAFMFLALYQYKSLPATTESLRGDIQELLDRFNFAAFSSPQGWKLAYDYDLDDNLTNGLQPGFTAGVYDGTAEGWVISLAAHLAVSNHVDIATNYFATVARTKAFLVDPARAHLVHSSPDFRAPFLQWLFDLFVSAEGRGRDAFPDPLLASNPHENAVLYQQEVHAKLAETNRPLFLQPDAADDGTCITNHYQQYSLYNDFGQPELFMPWSVAFSFLAEPIVAEAALRNTLAHGLYGPLGLTDSVRWFTAEPHPESLTARQDFWNAALFEMALVQYLYGDNAFLTSLPEVSRALARVFLAYPPGDVNGTGTVTGADSLLINQVLVGLRSSNDAVFATAKFANGDVNQTNAVNGADSLLINQVLVGLRPYVVTTILPSSHGSNQTTAVTIFGIGFPTNVAATVTIGAPMSLTLTNVVVISREQITALVPAGGGLGTGTVNVVYPSTNGVISFGRFINR